jgi:hypothetical protein
MGDNKNDEVKWKAPVTPDGDSNITRRPQPEPKPAREPKDPKW